MRTKRRGLSLVMVMAVIAVAGTLAAALLSSVSLQTQVLGAQEQSQSADALAQSGVELGVHYLNNIHDSTKCPFTTLAVGSTWVRNNNSLSSDIPGTYNLAVTRQSANRFRILAKGTVPSDSGTSISKTLIATADVNYTTHAATFAGNVTIPPNMTIDGDVYAPGTISNNGQIKGLPKALAVVGNAAEKAFGVLNDLLNGAQGNGNGNNDPAPPDGKAMAVPTSASVNHYATYVYNGRVYVAKTIATATLNNTSLGPTADNPAGIFIRNGTLDLNGGVQVNGTLVVMGGSLRVQGTGNAVAVSADNFPALVVDSDITYKAAGSTLDVTGLTWFGGRITRSSILVNNSSFSARGALLNPGGNSAFDANFGTISIRHQRTRSQVAGLVAATPRPTPVSVTIVNWRNGS